MPNVHQIRGARVVIYPNDHGPPHVHVIANGCEARFALNCPDGPLEILSNYGFTFGKAEKLARELIAEIKHLCAEWSRIHG